MIKKVSLLFLMIFLMNCQDKTQKEIKKINIEMKILRFDSIFFNFDVKNIQNIKKDYHFMFPNEVSDSVWLEKRSDTLQNELYNEVKNAFSDFSTQKKEIKDLFQHIKYYFPKFKEPKIITLTSDVDYNNRVIYADSLLLIGLDNYLGEKHRYYDGISQYIRFSFEKKFIPVDISQSISSVIIPPKRMLSFLDAMIFEGKKLYLMKKFLPHYSEEDLLKIPAEKLAWTKANESEIWRYFIENQLLYNTNKQTLSRFIDPAPFSKFYMEHDAQSPGGVGRYIGLKIVESYINQTSDDLSILLSTSYEDILKKSKYKPKK